MKIEPLSYTHTHTHTHTHYMSNKSRCYFMFMNFQETLVIRSNLKSNYDIVMSGAGASLHLDHNYNQH